MDGSGAFHYGAGGPTSGPQGERLARGVAGLVATLPAVRTVCDLGCGNGFLCGLLLERGYEVTGVDASESGVDVARRSHGARARFERGLIDAHLAARLGPGRFDAVVSSDVIEHLYRPGELIDCARHLLAPGGWLVLGTPYHGYLKNLALSLLGAWDRHHGVDWDGGHIKFFSVSSLSRMVEARGFRIVRYAYFGRAPWLWRNMVCIARRGD